MRQPPYTIDKRKPIPKRTRGQGATKYPFREMSIGDSFFAPHCTTAKLTAAASYYGPKRFSARKVTERGIPGARIWRIA